MNGWSRWGGPVKRTCSCLYSLLVGLQRSVDLARSWGMKARGRSASRVLVEAREAVLLAFQALGAIPQAGARVHAELGSLRLLIHEEGAFA